MARFNHLVTSTCFPGDGFILRFLLLAHASVVMITAKRSKAKIITERCALAHCSVASQYITRFQLLNPICFALGKFLFAMLVSI